MNGTCNFKGKCETPPNQRDNCPHYERCQLYENYRLLARTYLALQRERIAQEARLRKLTEQKADPSILQIMEHHATRFRNDEKAFLQDITAILKEHPIFEWAENVKGLGKVGAFILLHINPYKAQTVGQAKAFCGLAPELGLHSGRQANFDPRLKGRIWVITRNILMAKDPYYTPIYEAKKQYYLETCGYAEYIKNPQLCPNYQECRQRLINKAKRLGRKPKPPPCRAHVDNLARRFLAGILIGNALEILRSYEELRVDNIRAHRNYIPPKPHPEAVPPEQTLQNLKTGKI